MVAIKIHTKDNFKGGSVMFYISDNASLFLDKYSTQDMTIVVNNISKEDLKTKLHEVVKSPIIGEDLFITTSKIPAQDIRADLDTYIEMIPTPTKDFNIAEDIFVLAYKIADELHYTYMAITKSKEHQITNNLLTFLTALENMPNPKDILYQAAQESTAPELHLIKGGSV